MNKPARLDLSIPSEHEEQAALIEWCELHGDREPRLQLLFAIPNGARVARNTANKLKREGLKSGVPDLFLPVAGQWLDTVFPGLFIEMKRRRHSRVSPQQTAWHAALSDSGYLVAICKGWEDARDTICTYLGLEWQ